MKIKNENDKFCKFYKNAIKIFIKKLIHKLIYVKISEES